MLTKYSLPGSVDQNVSVRVKLVWDTFVSKKLSFLNTNISSYLQTASHKRLNQFTSNAVHWSANPEIPLACLDSDVHKARLLCDRENHGRQFHTEYLEYQIVFQPYKGKVRPKRVILTTEVFEYWKILARYEPEFLRQLVESITHESVTWVQLYGEDIQENLDKEAQLKKQGKLGEDEQEALAQEREAAFLNIYDRKKSVYVQNSLFMTLDKNRFGVLCELLAKGAQQFVISQSDGTHRPPTKYEIACNLVVNNILQKLPENYWEEGCNKADSCLLLAANHMVRQGQEFAIADPPGIYIKTEPKVLKESFLIGNKPICEDWIRLTRGNQRLEFGPPDDQPVFLDDINVIEGNARPRSLTGGYDIAAKIEVGPNLVVGASKKMANDKYIEIEPLKQLKCSEIRDCRKIRQMFDEISEQEEEN